MSRMTMRGDKAKKVTVELRRSENMIIATIDRDSQAGAAGYGATVPESLRDLAAEIECRKLPLPELHLSLEGPIRIK